MSTALHAAQDGARVLVAEAKTIGFGGSGRNVGLVNAGLWLPPGEVARKMGEAPARRLTQALAQGPALVFELIEHFQIECEVVRNGTLHCAHSSAGMRNLIARHDQLVATGAPIVLLDTDAAQKRVGSRAIQGALFDPRAGTIQPLGYARGLARAARNAGAMIVEGSPVRRYRHDGRVWQVDVNGTQITADALIEGTNANGTTPGRFAPLNFFQMATEPLPDALLDGILPGKEGCWDTATVMTSFRLDKAGRMIVGAIGGMGHAASGVHRRWAAHKMASLFPQLAGLPLTTAWSGVIANTADHLPKVLRLGPRGLSAFGYSGRGIGTGTVFGKAMARAVLSGDEGDLPIAPIDSYRDPLPRLRGLYYETGALAAHALGAVRAG